MAEKLSKCQLVGCEEKLEGTLTEISHSTTFLPLLDERTPMMLLFFTQNLLGRH